MKIKSNLLFNTSIMARHILQDKSDKKVIVGSSLPNSLNIPAGATIELEDSEWLMFAPAAKELIKAGHLTLVQSPKLSEEEQAAVDAKELSDAQAVVAKLSKKKGDK